MTRMLVRIGCRLLAPETYMTMRHLLLCCTLFIDSAWGSKGGVILMSKICPIHPVAS